jgi:hypothetical protein
MKSQKSDSSPKTTVKLGQFLCIDTMQFTMFSACHGAIFCQNSAHRIISPGVPRSLEFLHPHSQIPLLREHNACAIFTARSLYVCKSGIHSYARLTSIVSIIIILTLQNGRQT